MYYLGHEMYYLDLEAMDKTLKWAELREHSSSRSELNQKRNYCKNY